MSAIGEQLTWYTERRSFTSSSSWDAVYAERFTCLESPMMTDEEIQKRIGELTGSSRCRHCDSELSSEALNSTGDYPIGSLHEFWSRTVRACPTCGWWKGHYYSRSELIRNLGSSGEENSTHADGIVRRFNISATDAPLEALRHFIDRNPKRMFHTSPTSFEKLVGSVFSDFFHSEVVHVGGPGDAGVDLILVDSDRPCLIQVKRRGKSGHVEGVRAVRELVGTLVLNRAHKGIIVTSAESFSLPAKAAAKGDALQEQQIELELMDRDQFLRLLGVVQKKVRGLWNK